VGPIDKLRRALGDTASLEEAVARRTVADFISNMRVLCEEEGPSAFAHYLDISVDTELRQIAYLLVWNSGPKLEVWADVQRFDAVDLAVDACMEGFNAYVAAHAEA